MIGPASSKGDGGDAPLGGDLAEAGPGALPPKGNVRAYGPYLEHDRKLAGRTADQAARFLT
jgi:hypothetical protein